MSTLATLLPYAVSALAELRHSLRAARAWAIIAIVAFAYALIAMAGAGLKALSWGLVLMIIGVPVFIWSKREHKKNERVATN